MKSMKAWLLFVLLGCVAWSGTKFSAKDRRTEAPPRTQDPVALLESGEVVDVPTSSQRSVEVECISDRDAISRNPHVSRGLQMSKAGSQSHTRYCETAESAASIDEVGARQPPLQRKSQRNVSKASRFRNAAYRGGPSRKDLAGPLQDRLYTLRKARTRTASQGSEPVQRTEVTTATPMQEPAEVLLEGEQRLLARIEEVGRTYAVAKRGSGAAPRALPPDVFEDNDTSGAATTTAHPSYNGPGTYNSLTIDDVGDEDWFLYTASKNCLLNVELTFTGGRYPEDVELELYASNGTTMLRESISPTPNESIAYPVTNGTNYYIKVYGAAGDNVIHTYDMLIEELDPDAYEANETSGAAAVITAGTYNDLNIYSAADTDWFQIVVAQPTTLTVNVFFSPGGGYHDDGKGDLELYVYDDNPTQIASSETGDPNESVVIEVAAGTYYIQVDGWSDATNTYDMEIFLLDLPDLPAVELDAGATTIVESDARIQAILTDVDAGGKPVSNDVAPGFEFPIGATEVTYSVWQDSVGGTLAYTVKDKVVVLPFGQTPLYMCEQHIVSQSDVQGAFATAGNHGANLVRTADGTLHAAWIDLNDGKIVYQRSTSQNATTGVVTWDLASRTEITVDAEAFVALAASDNAVHFTWEVGGNVRYRRLLNTGGVWNLEADRDTTVNTGTSDNSPDIAAFSDDEVHVISGGNLDYAYTLDAGATWSREDLDTLKTPEGGGDKYPSVAVDSKGDVHVAFTQTVRDGWPPNSGGHWKVVYLRRLRPLVAGEDGVNTGKWVENHDTNTNFAEWADLGAGETVLQTVADRIEIQVDSHDNVHLGYHGTAISQSSGFDDTFYQFRPASGVGDADAWQKPLTVHGGSPDDEYSFDVSVVGDGRTDVGIPIIRYKALGLVPYWPGDWSPNAKDSASAMRMFQAGGAIDGGAITDLSNHTVSATEGMPTWWPCGSPSLHRLGDKVWLDVLHAIQPTPDDSRGIVVHQRVDVTTLMPPDRAMNPDPAHLATDVQRDKTLGWDAADRAQTYEVYWGTDQTAVTNATTASPEYQGSVSTNSLYPALGVATTTYYWRVDTVNGVGTTKGDTWSYTTGTTIVSQPPTFDSDPIYDPNPLYAGQTATLSVAATDPDGDTLTYTWTFGDGTGGTGASATHLYGVIGQFTATVTVTDNKGGTITAQVVVNVRDPMTAPDADFDGDGIINANDTDDDNDGVSDENETADGTDPYDASDFNTLPLQVDRLMGRSRFNSPGKDKVMIKGVIPGMPQGFNPDGQACVVNVGGVQEAFTLNIKGKSTAGNGRVKLRVKMKRPAKGEPKEFPGGDVKFRVKMGPGDYVGSWLDEGVDPNADKKKEPMTIVVTLAVNGRVYTATVNVLLTTKATKAGKFK